MILNSLKMEITGQIVLVYVTLLILSLPLFNVILIFSIMGADDWFE